MRFLIPLLFGAILSIHAAAPSADQLNVAAQTYLAKKPVTNIERGFTLEEGYKAQQIYVHVLARELGRPAGHKIGLITKAAQERNGATGPARGTLLKKMLLKNGAKVSPNQGSRPALEIDMGVIVGDEKINDAKTLSELIPHLRDFVCFIELVDSLTPTNHPTDVGLIAALNVGARAGILGDKRKMTAALAAALPQMKLSLQNSAGKTIAEVPALGLQPLENILWLIADLKKEHRQLKKGDFISLGSPAAPQLILAGETITLLYENIPGGPMRAKVRFKDSSDGR